MYGKLPVQAGHMCLNLGVAEIRFIDVSEEAVDVVVDRIKECITRIQKENFEGKPELYVL